MSKTKATGTISGFPVISTTKNGTDIGSIHVDIPDVGRAKATYFDDPESEHLFSFQDGDEVTVNWYKNGDWLNADILTPKGTADPELQLEETLREQSGDGLLDMYARTIILIRKTLQDNGLEDTIHEEVTLDAVEETFRTTTNSIFIELNKKGIKLNALLGE